MRVYLVRPENVLKVKPNKEFFFHKRFRAVNIMSHN